MRLHFCFRLWHSMQESRPRFRLPDLRLPDDTSGDSLCIVGLRKDFCLISKTKDVPTWRVLKCFNIFQVLPPKVVLVNRALAVKGMSNENGWQMIVTRSRYQALNSALMRKERCSVGSLGILAKKGQRQRCFGIIMTTPLGGLFPTFSPGLTIMMLIHSSLLCTYWWDLTLDDCATLNVVLAVWKETRKGTSSQDVSRNARASLYCKRNYYEYE